MSRAWMPAAMFAVGAACLALGAATVLTACGAVTITVGTVRPSPVPFRPATFGPGGSINGTYFRARLPVGWVNGAIFFGGQPNIEVAIKKAPTTKTGPVIIVTLTEAPAGLPLAPYADIVFHQDLQDRTAGKLRVLSSPQAAKVAGQPAESYTTSSDGNTHWTVITLWRGVNYEFQLAAPSGQFAAARSGPFRVFLQSWQWV